VDSARELIRFAKERSGEEIRYHIADASDLSILPAEHYSAVACVLAIQNMQHLRLVFENVAHCLSAGGRLVLVMMHPCFRSPKATSWGWDEKAVVQYRRVDRYLLPRKEPIVTHPGKDASKYTWTFHRPIQSYVKALRQAGMLVDAMEEWASHKVSQPGPRSAAENAARKEIPMFLAIRAIKPQGIVLPPPTATPGDE
jgi:ubiquinone/menaquinone biosynthesis C-methylase UbiE